jgi:hypothetical protein
VRQDRGGHLDDVRVNLTRLSHHDDVLYPRVSQDTRKGAD